MIHENSSKALLELEKSAITFNVEIAGVVADQDEDSVPDRFMDQLVFSAVAVGAGIEDIANAQTPQVLAQKINNALSKTTETYFVLKVLDGLIEDKRLAYLREQITGIRTKLNNLTTDSKRKA